MSAADAVITFYVVLVVHEGESLFSLFFFFPFLFFALPEHSESCHVCSCLLTKSMTLTDDESSQALLVTAVLPILLNHRQARVFEPVFSVIT